MALIYILATFLIYAIFTFFKAIPISFFFLLFIILWILFFLIQKKLFTEITKDNLKYLVILFFCIRFINFFSEPLFDDDWARYLWDGKMTQEFYTPYVGAPDVFFSFYGIFDEGWENVLTTINHPNLPTIYLPVFQFFFFVTVYFFEHDIIGLKICFLFFEILIFRLLYYECRASLKQENSNLTNRINQYKIWNKGIFWFTLSPIFILEFSIELHADVIGIFFLLAAFICLKNIFYSIPYIKILSRHSWILDLAVLSILIVFSLFTKPVIALIFPYICYILYTRKKIILFLAFVLGLSILIAFPLLNSTSSLTTPSQFYKDFEFNSSLFYVMNQFISKTVADYFFKIGFSIIYIWIFIKFLFMNSRKVKVNYDDKKSTTSSQFINPISFGIPIHTLLPMLLLLAPVAHAWYLCWVIPFLGFERLELGSVRNKKISRWKFNISWVEIWLVTIVLSYWIPIYGGNSEIFSFLNRKLDNKDPYSHNIYLQMIQFFPVYTLLCIKLFKFLRYLSTTTRA